MKLDIKLGEICNKISNFGLNQGNKYKIFDQIKSNMVQSELIRYKINYLVVKQTEIIE